MTAIILVILFIAIIFMGILAWGMCEAASEADDQEETENDNSQV